VNKEINGPLWNKSKSNKLMYEFINILLLLDGAVGRRVMLVWMLAMYIGQVNYNIGQVQYNVQCR